MRRIVTVLGQTSPEALGFTHSHEHLSIAGGHCAAVNPALRIDDPDRTLEELAAFAAEGGGGIVDAQPVGCGREAEVLVELMRRSGLHIIAATGFHKLEFYPEEHWLRRMDAGELAELFCRELGQGMFVDCDTGPPSRQIPHRAGIIKAALEADFEAYRAPMTAAAAAAVATGAALMVHIEQGSDPESLADFLQGRGVPPERMVFCHLDRMIPDPEVHKRLLERGIYLEYDTVARPKYHSDQREAELVAGMVGQGFGHRLLMGLDVTRERMISYGGSVGLPYLREAFLPTLRSHGVGEEQIRRIFVQNPAEAFAR